LFIYYQQSGYVGFWEPWCQCHDGTINFVKWFGWMRLHILSAADFHTWIWIRKIYCMDMKPCTIIGVGLVLLWFGLVWLSYFNHMRITVSMSNSFCFVLGMGGKKSGYILHTFFWIIGSILHTFFEFLVLKGFSSINNYKLLRWMSVFPSRYRLWRS